MIHRPYLVIFKNDSSDEFYKFSFSYNVKNYKRLIFLFSEPVYNYLKMEGKLI